MRNRCLLAFFILLPSMGFSQEAVSTSLPVPSLNTQHYLNLFLKTDFENSGSSANIVSLISKLERKQESFHSDKDFLRYVFVKAHQKILKRYTEHCTFSNMSQTGTYNCLTGTALYALLLNHFKIDYRVVETNYHIFLVAKTPTGNILLEATDPVTGFVDTQDEINRRISLYKENKMTNNNSAKLYYHYQFNIYNTVGLDELLGLMYYNLSVDAYNNQDLPVAINYLDRAIALYQSPRIEELSKIILLTLTARDIKKTEKEDCLKKIQSLRNKMPGLASNVNAH